MKKSARLYRPQRAIHLVGVAVATAFASGHATAEQVLSSIGLTSDNSDVEQLYTDQSSLGNVAYNSTDVNDALSFLSNNPTSATQGSYSRTYKYVTVSFPTRTSGTYTFGQSSSPSDTFLIVYDGAFNPENMAENFYTANDDNGGGWNSGATIPSGVTLGICGSTQSQCPVVETTLSAGTTYTLFMSHFSAGGAANFELPLGIFVSGPDGVRFATTGVSVYEATVEQRNTPGYQAARIIDSSNGLLEVFTANGVSGSENISQAVSETLPLLTGGGAIAARGALSGINSAVKARQNVTLGRSSGTGLNSGDALLQDKYFWIKPFGTRTEQDDRNGVSGYDADTGGLVLGLDGSFGQQSRVGVAFAYANTRVDGNSSTSPHKLDVDSYQLIGYGSHNLGNDTDVTFQVDFGQNRNEGERTIQFNSTKADADYDSYTAHLGLGLSRSYDLNTANRATAGLKTDYTWIRDESYRETGAGLLNLDVDSNTTEALVVGVEGQLSHSVSQSTELGVNLGLGYDVLNEQASITSSYAGAPTAQFTTDGIDPNPWIATGGFGLTHVLAAGAELSANYDAETRSDYLSQSVSLKLRWAF